MSKSFWRVSSFFLKDFLSCITFVTFDLALRPKWPLIIKPKINLKIKPNYRIICGAAEGMAMGSMFMILMKVYPGSTGFVTGWSAAAISLGYILGISPLLAAQSHVCIFKSETGFIYKKHLSTLILMNMEYFEVLIKNTNIVSFWEMMSTDFGLWWNVELLRLFSSLKFAGNRECSFKSLLDVNCFLTNVFCAQLWTNFP